VGDDVVVRAATEHHGDYSVSITMAMPIPPPMHSAAIP
jgi:hypothetical protein